tara:strand:- start:297 stop:479 length:183 start_codon:yes stop_codon:yes gene_type:complete
MSHPDLEQILVSLEREGLSSSALAEYEANFCPMAYLGELQAEAETTLPTLTTPLNFGETK